MRRVRASGRGQRQVAKDFRGIRPERERAFEGRHRRFEAFKSIQNQPAIVLGIEIIWIGGNSLVEFDKSLRIRIAPIQDGADTGERLRIIRLKGNSLTIHSQRLVFAPHFLERNAEIVVRFWISGFERERIPVGAFRLGQVVPCAKQIAQIVVKYRFAWHL